MDNQEKSNRFDQLISKRKEEMDVQISGLKSIVETYETQMGEPLTPEQLDKIEYKVDLLQKQYFDKIEMISKIDKNVSNLNNMTDSELRIYNANQEGEYKKDQLYQVTEKLPEIRKSLENRTLSETQYAEAAFPGVRTNNLLIFLNSSFENISNTGRDLTVREEISKNPNSELAKRSQLAMEYINSNAKYDLGTLTPNQIIDLEVGLIEYLKKENSDKRIELGLRYLNAVRWIDNPKIYRDIDYARKRNKDSTPGDFKRGLSSKINQLAGYVFELYPKLGEHIEEFGERDENDDNYSAKLFIEDHLITNVVPDREKSATKKLVDRLEKVLKFNEVIKSVLTPNELFSSGLVNMIKNKIGVSKTSIEVMGSMKSFYKENKHLSGPQKKFLFDLIRQYQSKLTFLPQDYQERIENAIKTDTLPAPKQSLSIDNEPRNSEATIIWSDQICYFQQRKLIPELKFLFKTAVGETLSSTNKIGIEVSDFREVHKKLIDPATGKFKEHEKNRIFSKAKRGFSEEGDVLFVIGKLEEFILGLSKSNHQKLLG